MPDPTDASETPANPPPAADPPETGDEAAFPERVREALRKERESAQAAIKQAKADAQRAAAAEAKLKALDDAALSATEKLQRERDEAQAENARLVESMRRQRVETAVLTAASKLGLADPADAYRLLDLDAVTPDDQGRPTNVEALLKDLVKAKPYLIGQPSGAASRGNTAGPNRAGGNGGASDIDALKADLTVGGRYARF